VSQPNQVIIDPITAYLIPLIQIISTFLAAWYVYYRIQKTFNIESKKEKQLKELYRPMYIIIKSSKLNFDRYLKANKDEQKNIADLWLNYNKKIKKIIMDKSYLFIEKKIPNEINDLLIHIDAYEYAYKNYKEGKIENPFPGEKGYSFPNTVESYFEKNCEKLAEELGAQ